MSILSGGERLDVLGALCTKASSWEFGILPRSNMDTAYVKMVFLLTITLKVNRLILGVDYTHVIFLLDFDYCFLDS